MTQPTNEMEWLLDIYSHDYRFNSPPDTEKIKLSQLISKLGFLYEKFRNAIDYNEEHLVRRNALERILKRQILFLAEKKPGKIGQTLIFEFIRARYLPNNELPETIIEAVSQTVEKYLNVIAHIINSRLPGQKKLIGWTISLAACEIGEQLNPAIVKEEAMANFMYSHLVDNLAFINTTISEKEKNLQIYLAMLKTLFKADRIYLSYQLLKLYVPNWRGDAAQEVANFCVNVLKVKNKIDWHINHPIGFQLTRTVRPQAVFFTILKEIMDKNKDELAETFHHAERLEAKIQEIAISKYQKIRGKLIGTIIRVIIYIFLTKTVLAFILELPYDYFALQQINWRSLGINVAFHPLLMFFIAITIRVPGQKNTSIIITEIKKIVSGQERKLVFKPKPIMRRGSPSYLIFNLIYLIMFAVSFGLIISALNFLQFNIVSGVLFVFFLTIVSFFGFRLRNLANQFSVLPRKDNLINFLIDFISLPIVRVGRFVSTNFSKINIFLFILDFIIETPFKLLVEFLEQTTSFIKEKREEITE